MSALWQALEEIDSYFGTDADGDELADEPAREVQARRANPDALTDALTDVWLTDKAREALHRRAIPNALTDEPSNVWLTDKAREALWRSARAARAEVEAK